MHQAPIHPAAPASRGRLPGRPRGAPRRELAQRARRAGLLALLACLLGPWTAPHARAAGPVLNIYNWSDYIAPTTVPDFEKLTGIQVRYDTFDNNAPLFAKLVSGDSGYDIVVPSSNWAAIELRGGLLRPLDKTRVPNLRNLDPRLMRLLQGVDPGNKYLVPWMWGYVTVGINEARVRQALGAMPLPANPWDLVFDPRYADRLRSCGISMLDSGGDLMEAAFNYLHIPQGTEDPDEFARAFALLRKVRPDITEFSSSGYINDLAGGSICAAVGFSGDMGIAAFRASQIPHGPKIRVFPPTHGAVIVIDTMAIPVTARNVDNAYRFIDYRLQPAVCAADSNAVYYANPVPASRAQVLPRVAGNDFVFLDPAMMDRLIPPKVYSAEQRRTTTRLYTRLRAGL